ncbi:unnamed protein product [Arabis nemorensis]|uniref:Uncharacterized protein n=1 Tax=Arabis nemorensis TaxID=586526 RepID=A0A565CG58_9BRAS|nr:unnamed protein product [Arabis nemorensis]
MMEKEEEMLTSAGLVTNPDTEDVHQGSDTELSEDGEDDEMDVESKMKEESENHGGRLRRKAIFEDENEVEDYSAFGNISEWKQGLKNDIVKKDLDLTHIVYGESSNTSLVNEKHESSDDDDGEDFEQSG